MSFQYDKLITARKEHRCDVCEGKIQAGEKYLKRVGTFEGDFYCSKECLACQPIISEYCRSDSYDEGYCGEWIQEWWREEKCPVCKNYYKPCKPNDMTHYCRCEKWEYNEPQN